MKKMSAFAALAACLILSPATSRAAGKSAADEEKAKAMANPYPNDLGPAELDKGVLAGYPKDVQAGYKIMLGSDKKKNCQSCHTAARPLNSRFLELPGKDEAERKASIEKLKKDQPEIFKDNTVWQVEWNIWNRYVKRMVSKPGCGISAGGKDSEAAKIWKFLVHDSQQRKTGADAAKWAEHRKKLVADFKAKYPKRYEELAKDNDL
ncbi:MAG: hypothetical protein HY921_02195 [Elusimicrobia bacterium]|nr:hypothetical protein [Elusimicrobiota bacterium]